MLINSSLNFLCFTYVTLFFVNPIYNYHLFLSRVWSKPGPFFLLRYPEDTKDLKTDVFTLLFFLPWINPLKGVNNNSSSSPAVKDSHIAVSKDTLNVLLKRSSAKVQPLWSTAESQLVTKFKLGLPSCQIHVAVPWSAT